MYFAYKHILSVYIYLGKYMGAVAPIEYNLRVHVSVKSIVFSHIEFKSIP